MSYFEVMDMPLRSFWSYNANVRRLRAEEGLMQIDLFLVGNSNLDGKSIQSLRESFSTQMGDPMKEDAPSPADPHVDLEKHKEGIARLRELKARMKP